MRGRHQLIDLCVVSSIAVICAHAVVGLPTGDTINVSFTLASSLGDSAEDTHRHIDSDTGHGLPDRVGRRSLHRQDVTRLETALKLDYFVEEAVCGLMQGDGAARGGQLACLIHNDPAKIAMSSLNKMLSLLEFFSIERPVWSSEELLTHSGLSRPTGYRYFKELCDSGLLRRAETGYCLGPRIIEMDYYIRQSDRLLMACRPVMSQLAQETACDVLLATIYGASILAVHQEIGAKSGPLAFGRGRPMPLFRGGGSKVIIASLSLAKHRRLYEDHAAEIAEAGLGATFKDFRARMMQIQRDGHVLSVGELDPNAAGAAVPVSSGTLIESSAMIMVTTRPHFALIDKPMLIERMQNAARQIEIALTRAGQPQTTGL